MQRMHWKQAKMRGRVGDNGRRELVPEIGETDGKHLLTPLVAEIWEGELERVTTEPGRP